MIKRRIFCYAYIGNYKYVLRENLNLKTVIVGYSVENEYFALDTDGLLTIYSGYSWDGVSGPMIDSDNSMLGGCVHDALYQMIRMGLIEPMEKEFADLIMKQLFIRCGMSKIRAGYAYYGVKWFGASSCVVGDIHTQNTITLIC